MTAIRPTVFGLFVAVMASLASVAVQSRGSNLPNFLAPPTQTCCRDTVDGASTNLGIYHLPEMRWYGRTS